MGVKIITPKSAYLAIRSETVDGGVVGAERCGEYLSGMSRPLGDTPTRSHI